MVIEKMDIKFKKSFRDIAELNQATQFLHDNGVLLHYDDASLGDVYFLDPQWLCDVLANIVTIPEINRLAVRGRKMLCISCNLGFTLKSNCFICNV